MTPPVLQNRRVEITGPANDPKMVINMLNSGADACMIDLEDSMAPSAQNVVDGHYNIHRALRGELVHEQLTEKGQFKRYQIGLNPCTPMVRVRGLHMKEVHATAAHLGPMPAAKGANVTLAKLWTEGNFGQSIVSSQRQSECNKSGFTHPPFCDTPGRSREGGI